MAAELSFEKLNTPSSGVFLPGAAITGTVVCKITSSKNYDQIVVHLLGRFSKWFVASSGFSEGTGRSYHRDELISKSVVLWDRSSRTADDHGGSINNYDDLSPGEHRFNFSLVLANEDGSSGEGGDNEIPASCNERFGKIRYTLHAETKNVLGAYASQQASATALLTVGNVVSSSPQQPVSNQLCHMPALLQRHYIKVSAQIPQREFRIGFGNIPVDVQVENFSTRTVQSIQTSFRKVVVYSYYPPPLAQTEKDIVKLTKITRNEGVAPSSRLCLSERLAIPSKLSPTLEFGGISIKYVVRIKLKVSWSVRSPYIDLPVSLSTNGVAQNSLPSQYNFFVDKTETNFLAASNTGTVLNGETQYRESLHEESTSLIRPSPPPYELLPS